ncbi:hypothetical protein [Chlorobaculum limnaeum]|uniref:hypothetical protein n=1 Tax=Chlorobaculum limnaeum TaxID=274537 RepID=UPI0012EE2FB3|nr:hypothetical protein [Chlorobaculum limnaeum]
MIEEKSQHRQRQRSPVFGPYFLSGFLFIFGLWCAYDGWFTTDPEMFAHMDFNRTLAAIFIVLALIDFVRTLRFRIAQKSKR